MEIRLEAATRQEELIKAYLEENADAAFASKINDGVFIEKDGQRLLSRKTLKGCISHIRSLAKKQAVDNCAVIEDCVVFQWAVEYFQNDTIEEKLIKEDGTEYVKQATAKKASKTDEDDADEETDDNVGNTPVNKNSAPKKSSNGQMNFFDMLG